MIFRICCVDYVRLCQQIELDYEEDVSFNYRHSRKSFFLAALYNVHEMLNAMQTRLFETALIKLKIMIHQKIEFF